MSSSRGRSFPSPLPSIEDGWLYVLDEEIGEALTLGARTIDGDSRLVMPTPMPPGITSTSFSRWRSDEARYRWCMKTVSEVLGERVGLTDPDALLAEISEGAAAHERVYLFVPSYDAALVREEVGVHWDRRRRMFYAMPDADINKFFVWLTPAARQAWEAERNVQRALSLLVQDRARTEATSAGSGGGIGSTRIDKPSRFVRPPSQVR